MSPASRVSCTTASSNAALSYFEDQFRYETDCWDVHDALSNGPQDFVLLDVRGTEKYQAGHVAGALDLARQDNRLQAGGLSAGHLFVVYCAGPHCNGAARAAIRLAQLGGP
jgi:rhodanese-related sulfurtransferase